jgi:hypothetical protein
MADSASYVLGYTPEERQRLIFQGTLWREVTEDAGRDWAAGCACSTSAAVSATWR